MQLPRAPLAADGEPLIASNTTQTSQVVCTHGLLTKFCTPARVGR